MNAPDPFLVHDKTIVLCHFVDAGKADLLSPQRQLSVDDPTAQQPSPRPSGLRSRNASYSDMGSALPASISSTTSIESGWSLSLLDYRKIGMY